MIFSGPIKKWINTGYSHFVHEFHSFNVGIVQFDDHIYVVSNILYLSNYVFDLSTCLTFNSSFFLANTTEEIFTLKKGSGLSV